MTVKELIEALKEFHPRTEVRIASQPNYPLEYQVFQTKSHEGVFYIVEGTQVGYASRSLWAEEEE